jgi:prepilin-type N-terminal cleavage/methylation domain-containing protein
MRRHNGFSLMEVMIAMLVLLLVLGSFGVLLPLSQIGMKNTATKDVAYTLAENMIENIRALDCEKIKVPARFSSSPFAPLSTGELSDPVTYLDGQYPPLPYPCKEYEFQSGNIVAPDGSIRIPRKLVNFYYRVTTENEMEGGVPIDGFISLTVEVFWTEARAGRAGNNQQMITVTSKIMRRL